MREILFRAKRIDYDKFPKEEWWIEGNAFVHDDGRTVDISTGTEKFSINKRVIPETLCQYTGLTDKNGKRIWENDIVRIENSMDEGIGNIEFYGGMWYVDGEPSNSLYDIVEYDDGELEVIENIFDTQELLKGGLTCRN